MRINDLLSLTVLSAILTLACLASTYGTVATAATVTAATTGYAQLETLTPTSARVGWDTYRVNMGPAGAELELVRNGSPQQFTNGIFAHANAEIVFNIEGGGATRFTTLYGVNRSANDAGRVRFDFYIDDVLVLDGSTVGPGYFTRSVECGVADFAIPAGARTLRLVATGVAPGANPISNAHAVWVDPKIYATNIEELGRVPIVTKTLTVPTLNQALIQYTASIGFMRANSNEREPLGFILPADATFRVRQINPNFRGVSNNNISIEVWSNRREGSVTVPNNGDWVTVTARVVTIDDVQLRLDSVPFVRTPTVPADATEQPVIEFEFLSSFDTLPIYDYTNSYNMTGNQDMLSREAWDGFKTPEAAAAHAAFNERWTHQQFALIRGRSVQLLVSLHDQPRVRELRNFANLDQLLGYYDHMTGKYDYWAGLDPAYQKERNLNIWQDLSVLGANPIHDAPATRYFGVAHIGGPGGGYWAGGHMGQSGPSLESFYLSRYWGGLHEVGHSMQGHMMNNIPLGEVWNNIYAHFYQTMYVVPTHPYIEGGEHGREWLYTAPRDRAATDRAHHQQRLDGLTYHTGGFRERLYFWVRMIDSIGGPDKAFRGFNKLYRETHLEHTERYGNTPQHIRNWRGADVHCLLWSQVVGYDLSPYFEAYGLLISDHIKEQLAQYDPMYILIDVVTDADKRAEIVAQHGLISEYGLVSKSQLAASGITVLPSPTALRWSDDGGMVYWNRVPGATRHFVALWENGRRIATSDWIIGTSYDFSSHITEGTYHFTVNARAPRRESPAAYSSEMRINASGARMIDVDTTHPAFVNSTTRVEVANSRPFGIHYSFTTGRPTGNAVRTNTGAGYGHDGVVGEVQSDEFGAATAVAIYPFKGTQQLDSFTIRTDRWNDANAQQEVDYVRFYASIDGENWTELGVREGASRTHLVNANSYALVTDPTNTAATNVVSELNGNPVNIPVWKIANGENHLFFDKAHTANFFKLRIYGKSYPTDYTRLFRSFMAYNNISFWSAGTNKSEHPDEQ